MHSTFFLRKSSYFWNNSYFPYDFVVVRKKIWTHGNNFWCGCQHCIPCVQSKILKENGFLREKEYQYFLRVLWKKNRHVCQNCNLHFQRRFQGKIDFLEPYSILPGFSDFAQNVFSYLGKTFCRGWQNLILSVQMKISMEYTSIAKQHFIIFLEIFCEKFPAWLSKKDSTFAEEVPAGKKTFYY